jgi:hypothetical protein
LVGKRTVVLELKPRIELAESQEGPSIYFGIRLRYEMIAVAKYSRAIAGRPDSDAGERE